MKAKIKELPGAYAMIFGACMMSFALSYNAVWACFIGGLILALGAFVCPSGG